MPEPKRNLAKKFQREWKAGPGPILFESEQNTVDAKTGERVRCYTGLVYVREEQGVPVYRMVRRGWRDDIEQALADIGVRP